MSIKLNQSLENSLVNCTLVKTTPVEESYNNYAAERVISWLAYSQVDKTSLTSNDMASYVQYLDAKLNTVRKTATFWDAYNIREVASNLNDFIQKYAVLPNNSSLVINTGSFVLNGKTYQHGDIIIKDNSGQEVQVKNESTGGVYYPDSIVPIDEGESGNLRLTFRYGSVTKEDISLDFNAKEPQSGELYSGVYTKSNFSSSDGQNKLSMAALVVDGKPVIPFWECRELKSDNTYGEKIFNLISLEVDTTSNTIQFIAATLDVPFVLIVK